VAKGQRDGTVRRDLSPEREATLVVAGLRGLGYQWLLDPDRFDIVVALGDLRDVTLERLAADVAHETERTAL
jgi:hypothetical protein